MDIKANKRKILFITPDFMGYTDVIRVGIEEHLNAEVLFVATTGNDLKFVYKNSFYRIQNFFSKLFLRRNQKRIFYNKKIKERLETVFKEHPHFDDILILRPDLIKMHLPFIKTHGKRFIAHFWDSFSRIPEGRKTILYFDKFFSFEPKDVKDHQLLFLPNFYSPELVTINKNEHPHFDLSYIASYDRRAEMMEKILVSLTPLDLKTNINILTPKTIGSKNKYEKSITWFTDVLPRKETIRIMNDSNVLLDIAQPKQEGLSFRIFEAMILGKKLITTNRSIASYDIYDSNNIFIWEEGGTIPAKDFFKTAFSALPDEVIKKYSLQNWVRQLFEK